ncbi:MAG: glutathione S-transferase family protein [Gammaproteobacteria bacterium]|nr:glutathione S-transferase family protein [Gammaproteobacteria bacterium]
MIKIYGYPQTRSRRLTWMMEELEQDYEFVLIDLFNGGGQSPEFLAINPAGKVPAMADGDLLLTESAAILNYLGDKWPEKQLIPELGTAARGLFYQWSHFVMAELEQPLWTLGKHRFALPEEQRVPEIMPTASWEFQKALSILETGLGDKPYILGDSFGGADILISHTLIWGINFKQEVSQQSILDYLERCRGRDALARAIAREEALLPEKE